MGWRDDDDLTTPAEGAEGPPALSRVLDSARPGDTMTFRFDNDGRDIETDHGKAVVFDVYPLDSDVPLRTKEGDDAKLDGSEVYAFITGSARLLQELAKIDPIDGEQVEIEVIDTGMNAQYSATAL